MNIERKSPFYSKKWWRKLAYLYIAIIFTVIVIDALGSNASQAVIRTKSGDRHIISIEIADTFASKSKGLSLRPQICDNCGMLFVYKRIQRLNFWMKDTEFALDIAFLDENMKILEIIRNMKPFSEEVVSSSVPAKYALEMPNGYFDKNGIKVNDRLLF